MDVVDKHCTGWTENNHKTVQNEDKDGSTSSEWSTLYRSDECMRVVAHSAVDSAADSCAVIPLAT